MLLTNAHLIGLGDTDALFSVYIGNRPNTELSHLKPGVSPLNKGDIQFIGNKCGHGWRKVFNVYAKLVYALASADTALNISGADSWQAFRDSQLLQAGSGFALHFHAPEVFSETALHLITGKTYANTLPIASQLHWINSDFALCKKQNIVVCPYFDYRQLSNAKILYLIDLLKTEQFL